MSTIEDLVRQKRPTALGLFLELLDVSDGRGRKAALALAGEVVRLVKEMDGRIAEAVAAERVGKATLIGILRDAKLHITHSPGEREYARRRLDAALGLLEPPAECAMVATTTEVADAIRTRSNPKPEGE